MRLSQRTSSNVAEYRKTLMDELRNLQAQLAKHPLDGWNFTTDTFLVMVHDINVLMVNCQYPYIYVHNMNFIL